MTIPSENVRPAPLSADTTGVLRLPDQILFGAGSVASVPNLVQRHGSRALICSDPTMARTSTFLSLVEELQSRGVKVAVFAQGVPEVPLTVIGAAVQEARAFGPDVIVGFGGGSSLDLAKATALLITHPGPLSRYYGENLVPGPVCPLVAIPTTAGTGSEVTPVAVVSDPERLLKVGVSSPYLVPTYAVVDPSLTLGCPQVVSAHSGADALAHALESLTAGRRTPNWGEELPVFVGTNRLGRTLALEAVTAIASSLRRVVSDPADESARTSMSYASLCAAMSFGSAGTHLGHALQYSVGAATHTSHGLGVGLLLPYVLEVSRSAREADLLAVADALGVPSGSATDDRVTAVIDEVQSLFTDIGIPRSLAEIGADRAQLPAFAAQTSTFARLVQNAPVPADESLLLAILEAAWDGDRTRLSAQAGSR
ncbi:iron-containing alcohol dehydrogenase [Ornithinimicrobium murale]|uniref:iron-containing alcohol dehydrogenase n=1 Tax=Ornithinimicrobium murale TaxID=1050153 RepID=UPI000E0D1CBC|nr:iron-containing alcohol dehydrogenase [Ornithinimicrobium murale]